MAWPVGEHWKIYLPAVLLSFAAVVPAIIAAEKRGWMKMIFNACIVLLLVVQAGFAESGRNVPVLFFCLLLFFVAFNILEAVQPSLISRIAPPYAKGAALGIYNTTQSLGLFLGGFVGGWLAKAGVEGSVWLACSVLLLVWLGLGLSMRLPVRNRPADFSLADPLPGPRGTE